MDDSRDSVRNCRVELEEDRREETDERNGRLRRETDFAFERLLLDLLLDFDYIPFLQKNNVINNIKLCYNYAPVMCIE